jgi:tetratricopeptide (TPR) repeat protein
LGARETNLAAAAIFASIGKPRGEAIALVNASLPAARLGLFASAAPGLERALAIFASAGDVYGQAVCTINLSYGCLQRGASEDAKRFAGLPLSYARTLQNKVFLAEALANLGAAERDLGELSEAVAHMQAGIAQQAPDVRRGDQLNDRADLALARFYAGAYDEAARMADDFIGDAADEDVLNLWPHKLAWYAARIYRAVGRTADARRLVERAHAVMEKRARSLSNDREREEAASLPLHRSIAAAWERDEWPMP